MSRNKYDLFVKISTLLNLNFFMQKVMFLKFLNYACLFKI